MVGVFQYGGEVGNINVCLVFQFLWVDFFNGWCKDIIDFVFVQFFIIFLQCVWIMYQIVWLIKLYWIDENVDDYYISLGFCFIDQFYMVVVQVVYGGNQCDVFIFLMQMMNMLVQQWQGFNDQYNKIF